MDTRTDHGASIPLPPTPPRRKAPWEDAEERRTWRMANNRDAYPIFEGARELSYFGLGGKIVINERFCRECWVYIEHPHRLECPIGNAEEGACP